MLLPLPAELTPAKTGRYQSTLTWGGAVLREKATNAAAAAS
jgi:hypothetical protein